MSFNLKVEKYEKEYAPMFQFIYSNGGVTASMTFEDNSVTTSTEWWKFIDNVKEGKNGSINTCPSNGEVSVSSDHRYVEFRVSKCGSGGDGSSILTVPKDMCVDAFISAATALEKWEKKQALEESETDQ